MLIGYRDLINNQLAAKELYVAKYYISTQKWVPAISRLKIIVNDYKKTIFSEEALHRRVEIHYYLGLPYPCNILTVIGFFLHS